MSENDDSSLRDQFQALKQHDRELAPEFARETQPRGAWVLNYRVAGAALVMILIAGFAVRQFLDRRGPAEVSIAQISNWHSPTGSLLEISGSHLLQTLPQFDGSFPTSEIK
jgi:hypothetical protein